jgi:glucose-6-phosphate 1-dehydrogenase
MQNHMLQVLCVLAMETPASSDEGEPRDARMAVLSAARILGDDAATHTRRARYTAGRIGDRDVPAYADEEGVDPDRCTETFAEVQLVLDTPRWRGTRFVLRAGKALGERRKEAVVRFRGADSQPARGYLRIGIDGPHDLELRLSGGAPVTLTAPPPSSALPPYGHVLRDLLAGGSALSVRGDEAEEAWRVVDPVLAAWREGAVPLEEYAAGSAGLDDAPNAAQARRSG